MKTLKRILAIIIFFIMSIMMVSQSYSKNLSSFVLTNSNEPIKVSVLIGNFDIYITSLIKDNLAKIEQENPNTIHYTFYNGEGNQDIQNNQLNTLLSEKSADLILLDLSDVKYTNYVLDKIKESNIPVLFWGNFDINIPLSYSKAYYIRPDPAEGGVLQGKILVDQWNKDKTKIDKNGDNTLQYIMLQGTTTNIYAIERTKYSLIEMQKHNIKNEELATKICNWSEDEAKNTINDLLLMYGNKIEVIIANDDTMAIGAIRALQEHGYNLENGNQDIKVIGFDGISKAQELIKSGVMSGTVFYDPYEIAKILYTVGMNLINDKNLIEGTSASLDITGKLVIIPYQGVIVNFK